MQPVTSLKKKAINGVTFSRDADDRGPDKTNARNPGQKPSNKKKKKQVQHFPQPYVPRIIVRQGEAPSKRLILRMMELQDELGYVNKRITSGLNIEPEDWELVRKNTNELQALFQTKVEFDWEQKHNGRRRSSGQSITATKIID